MALIDERYDSYIKSSQRLDPLGRKLEDIKLISIVMIPFASAVVGLFCWPNGA